jgi:transposase-like protein
MKFEDVYGRWQQRRLDQAEAAEILGMSEHTFRRWRERYAADGREGLLDRRLRKASVLRVPTDQAHQVLTRIASATAASPLSTLFASDCLVFAGRIAAGPVPVQGRARSV